MVVEIPPVAAPATAEKTAAEIPPPAAAAVAGRQLAVGRTDSTEIPPGTSAAVAVAGNQSAASEGDYTDSASSRRPVTTNL